MSFLVESFVWLTLSIYAVAYLPQVVENYKIKSTHGVSRAALIAFFVAHAALLYYTFLMNLILPYKMVAPLQFAGIVAIVLQRFYYDGLFTDKIFFWSIVVTTLVGVGVFPLVLWCPLLLGSVGGWLSFSLFLFQAVPQVVKNYQEKSVKGFSLGFVLLLGAASACEIVVVFIKGFPLQTKMMAFRGVIFAIIFCAQFLLYSRNTAKRDR